MDSHGLVLCASDASHERVDPVAPPPGAANGDRVTFAGFEGEPDKEINESVRDGVLICRRCGGVGIALQSLNRTRPVRRPLL